MRNIILLALIVSACTTEPSFAINISMSGDTDPNDPQDMIEAARLWEPASIGSVQPTNGTPECVRQWWASFTPCTITIAVRFVGEDVLKASSPPGSGEILGIADVADGVIYLANDRDPIDIVPTAAHEIGHVLFDSGDHLPPGELGLMDATYDGSQMVTDADLFYASQHTQGWMPP